MCQTHGTPLVCVYIYGEIDKITLSCNDFDRVVEVSMLSLYLVSR
jgi:hypothetical protein